MKKSQKETIDTPVSGSVSYDKKEPTSLDLEGNNQNLLEALVEKLLASQWIEEELIQLADKPITMLIPSNSSKRVFLFSPALGCYRDVAAPVEAMVIEESNGKETLCLINNIPYMVPDKYLKEVGFN